MISLREFLKQIFVGLAVILQIIVDGIVVALVVTYFIK
jgi:hypothetical protein